MRITDPAWPAVQEAARMMLREDVASIMAPQPFHDALQELVLKMGDSMAARQHFPLVTDVELDVIILTARVHSGPVPKMYCGIENMAQYPETLWIPKTASELMETLIQTMHDLLEAGYPGCLGCGGPGAEEEWDETASRKRMKVKY